jgi:competence protein ComEA
MGSMLGLLFAAVILLVISPRYDQDPILLPTRGPETVMVYVTGEVNEPGLYPLPPNSRVFDAIQSAGGFTEAADQEAINLAAILEDEDRIDIPSLVENSEKPYSGQKTILININTASVDELDKLPGVGPVKAQAIVDFREKFGVFLSIKDLLKVNGINQDLFDQIEDSITINP